MVGGKAGPPGEAETAGLVEAGNGGRLRPHSWFLNGRLKDITATKKSMLIASGLSDLSWKTGKLENWKTGKLENWKTGRPAGIGSVKPETTVLRPDRFECNGRRAKEAI
jgi:hypothetical protein